MKYPIIRKLIVSFLALPAMAGMAQAQGSTTEPVKIFILAGQSNMVGHGEMNPGTTINTLTHLVDPANDTTGAYQFLKDGAGWKVLNDVWISFSGNSGNLTTGYGSRTDTIGPELGFGHVASGQYENQVLIIKCAWGGKSLGNDFLPPSAESYPPPQADGDKGYYYQQILNTVANVTANLATIFPGYAGQGYEIAGFGWHQGYNDRIDSAFSAAYQTNMAHFIRDIRSADKGLDVPGLPFVIVTSAMDGNGPLAYSTVEKAQRAMVDPYLTNPNPPDLYPDFVGNVAVVDARQTYNGLQFWHSAPQSPADQNYHWNRNAKTYVNIGLAMGDAMAGLAPGRCPSRLRAAGVASGIELTWQNGVEEPTSVQVKRNGVEIAAAAPVTPASFIDTAALPGVHQYELNFTMPGDPCDPLTFTFDGGITDLIAFRSPSGVGLTWKNRMTYSGIEVRRDGAVIEANLPGSTTSYTDTAAPSSGLVTYTVVPTTGTSTPAEAQISLNGLPAGNALIYEPFDYPVGPLHEQSGASERGLAGTWDAYSDIQTLVAPGTFSFGELPVGGGKIEPTSGNRFGGARAIQPAALAEQGLLDPGRTLWFSMIVGMGSGANLSNTRLGVALANSAFDSAKNQYSIRNEGSQLGSGIGIFFGVAGSDKGAVVATQFRDYASGKEIAGLIRGSWSGKKYAAGQNGLIVGKITWGAAETDPDVVELFQPGIDLALPASPISVLSTHVNQSEFDTLTFARGDKPVLDEIRFGRSYDSVVGKVSYADWIAGYSGVGAETDFADDPDGDGLDNGVESYLGTHPGVSNGGLSVGELTGGAFTFSHPLNPTPPDDITAAYKWSTDLTTWNDDGATVNDTQVSFHQGTPSGGVVEVTANISGPVPPERVFFVIKIEKQP